MATRGQSKYMAHMRAKAAPKRSLSSGGVGHLYSTPYVSDTMRHHDAMIEKAAHNPVKGERDGDCNRTQCQRPHSWWYNKTMQAYYCGDCAGAINESCLSRDHIASFGSKTYVNPPTAKLVEFEEACQVVVTTADGTESVYASSNTKEEAEQSLREFYREADLRSDGSAPFHFSELREKMLRMRGLIQERYPDQELVEFV